MYPIQHRKCMDGIDNLLVLLIGGIPIALPIVLSVTMAIGSHRLSQQGAITKRITVIEEMTGMNVLCSYKIGTLNKLIDGEEAEERRERAGRLHGSSESSTVLVLWFSEKGGGFIVCIKVSLIFGGSSVSSMVLVYGSEGPVLPPVLSLWNLGGGLALWWNEEAEIYALSSCKNLIDTHISIMNDGPWFCSFVCEPLNKEDKVEFWMNMSKLRKINETKWHILGDAIMVVIQEEKLGGLPVDSNQANGFLEIMNCTSVMELPLKGGNFTWLTRREN
ncbi:hypothetical protein V6N13_126641 [Hibiscus sabdariffa]